MLFFVALIATVAAVSTAQKTWTDVHECKNAAFERCKDRCKDKIDEDSLLDFEICHFRKHEIFKRVFADCVEALKLPTNETSQCYRRKHEKSESKSKSKSKEVGMKTTLPGFQTGATGSQQPLQSSVINDQQSVTPAAVAQSQQVTQSQPVAQSQQVTQSQQVAQSTGPVRSKRHGQHHEGKGHKAKSSSSEERGGKYSDDATGGKLRRHHKKRSSSSSSEERHHRKHHLDKPERRFLHCKKHCAKPEIEKCFEGCAEGGLAKGDELQRKTHKCWRLAERISHKHLFKCLRDTKSD